MNGKTGPEIVSTVVRHVRRSGSADFAHWCIGVAESTPSFHGLLHWVEACDESEAKSVVHHMTEKLGMKEVGTKQGRIVFTYPEDGDSH